MANGNFSLGEQLPLPHIFSEMRSSHLWAALRFAARTRVPIEAPLVLPALETPVMHLLSKVFFQKENCRVFIVCLPQGAGKSVGAKLLAQRSPEFRTVVTTLASSEHKILKTVLHEDWRLDGVDNRKLSEYSKDYFYGRPLRIILDQIEHTSHLPISSAH